MYCTHHLYPLTNTPKNRSERTHSRTHTCAWMSVNTEYTHTHTCMQCAYVLATSALERHNVVCWMIRMLQPTHTIGTNMSMVVCVCVRAHSFMHRLPYSISICLAEWAYTTKPTIEQQCTCVCVCVRALAGMIACWRESVCNEKNSKNKENTTNYKWFDVTSETETAMNATHGSQMVTA